MSLVKPWRTITWLAGTCILVLALTFFFARHTLREFQISSTTMGTTYNIKYIVPADSGLHHHTLRDSITACLQSINQKMSTYIPDSELSRFNAHVENSPFVVTKETFEIFQLAQQISEQTGGAFDITVGPIVNAYGFGPEPRPTKPPTDQELETLRQRVGFRMIKIDQENTTLAKSRPDIYCDLSAVAKGYAVDQIAKILDDKIIQNYMVEIGGETRVKGNNIHGRPWRIGIEKPTNQGRQIHRVLELTNKAIATSGDYRNFYMHHDVRISHTIDPRTGRQVTHNLASVSVIHDRCADADAWATALMVLGAREGYKIAENRRIAALFLVHQEDEKIIEKETTAFLALVQDS